MQVCIKSKISYFTLLSIGLSSILLTGCGQKNEMGDQAITGFMTQKGVNQRIGSYTIPQKQNSDLPKNWEEARKRWEESERLERQREAPAREHARKILVEPFKKYPKDFPIVQMPKSEVFFAKAPTDWQGRTREKVVILQSKERPVDIAFFYRNKLQADGWKIRKEEGNAGYYEVKADKPDSEMNVVIYARGYDGCMIQVENKKKSASHK